MKRPGAIFAAFAIVLVAVLVYLGGGKEPPTIGSSAKPVADAVDTAAAAKDRIAKCEVWVDMSKAELLASWGPPARENVTRNRAMEVTQLVYRHIAGTLPVHRCGKDALPENAFVYLEGDRVTAIQEYE